jgi:hypothetical protein
LAPSVRQQHDGEAGVRDDGHHGADGDLQQDVAGQRLQQRPHGRRLHHDRGGFGHQAQRQQHQAQADQHAADAPRGRGLLRDEQHDADEDEEGRQPREVEGEHDHHQAGAHVGAQHHGQRGGQCDQPLPDEGGDDQGRGRTGLHQRGDAQAGHRRRRTGADAARQDMAEVGTEDAQDARANEIRAPDQQRHGRQQVQQMLHV